MADETQHPADWQHVRGDLALLGLICLVLGAIGGVPVGHPDQVVGRALAAIQGGGNPHFFNYPGLVIYLNMAVYAAAYVVMRLFGLVAGPVDFAQLYKRDILLASPVDVPFLALGHAVTLCFSVLGIVCAYLIVRMLLRRRIFAFLSGALLATSLLWVVNSHYPTVDVPMAALAAATATATLSALHARSCLTRRWIVAIGVLLGLTASAKYNGALIGLTVGTATLLAYQDRRYWLKHNMLVLLIATATFLMTNPFSVLSADEFIRDVTFELRHSRVGHPGYTTDLGWLFHLRTTLSQGIGVIPLALAAVGAVWSLRTASLSHPAKASLLVFPGAYYLLMGNSSLAFQRYMLPMLPFIAVLAVIGLYALYRSMMTISPRIPALAGSMLAIGAVGATGWNLQLAMRHNLLLRGTDTRVVLEQIINDARLETPGNRIVLGSYTRSTFFREAPVVLGRPDNASVELVIFDIFEDNLQVADHLSQPRMLSSDVLIFDSFSHDGLIYDPAIRRYVAPDLFDSRIAIQISPFARPKDQVPFSPESLYSPYPPDLQLRQQPGPFIELYIRDRELAQAVFTSCRDTGASCTWLPGHQAYYAQHLTRLNQSLTGRN